jgi:hypothetical protein
MVVMITISCTGGIRQTMSMTRLSGARTQIAVNTRLAAPSTQPPIAWIALRLEAEMLG